MGAIDFITASQCLSALESTVDAIWMSANMGLSVTERLDVIERLSSVRRGIRRFLLHDCRVAP